ncbi:oxidoreductase family protein [Alteromonas sp. KUL106]|uniref:oxidoreductase family protein n=1 Tax=Alteromonas sp. KUL106 TaxID=2480799 RepID=UPI0012E4A477|nr:oxidoreductase family protein [Alteromonas sp. KUL106]GFD69663.1 hypothetical protein KUL106_29260 [Alteromonas sp. KUL106]GFD77153.1 hypothetical protein KUL118_00150 [Tenacibaculum sp. KUL118]
MENTVNQAFIDWLGEACNARVVDTKMIQPLWSSYGACFRAELDYSTPLISKKGPRLNSQTDVAPMHDDALSTKSITHVVVKIASPPVRLAHPKGWNGQQSDKRKRHSFRVENHFYSEVQPLTTEKCRTATCITHDRKREATLLVMEDLAHNGYTHTAQSLTVASAKTVLKWLAHFHARFLNKVHITDSNLWQEGTYWHLSTREDEYHAMPDSLLKQHAGAISNRLSGARYQTLVHGDAKVANFCFTANFSSCAAVDFQYVGYGVGVKDVAYFLGSALTTKEQQEHRQTLLGTYFAELETALRDRTSEKTHQCDLTGNDIAQIIAEWKDLYCFACADFNRFLVGWSPDHWKIEEELQYQTDIAIARLGDSG